MKKPNKSEIDMNLERRVEAVEAELAELKSQQLETENLAKMMRDVAAETVKNARRPGGMLDKSREQAAIIEVAAFKIKSGVVNIKSSQISASESV